MKANGAFKLERGVPLPPKSGKPGGLTDTIRKMKEGESFVIPPGRHVADVWPIAKHLGVKLTSRRQPDGSTRIWRIESK